MIFVNHYLQTDQMATEQRLSDQFSNQESSASSLLAHAWQSLLSPLQYLQNNLLAWLLLAGLGAEWAGKVLQLR